MNGSRDTPLTTGSLISPVLDARIRSFKGEQTDETWLDRAGVVTLEADVALRTSETSGQYSFSPSPSTFFFSFCHWF